jgi:hypothetical protein
MTVLTQLGLPMQYTPGLIDDALRAEGINGVVADLARSIYTQESSAGANTKTSNRGAVGGMQILPGTFKSVADKDWDITNPLQNVRAGVRYLAQLNKQAGGDPFLTAAGYYGGPGGLEKARRGIGVKDPMNPDYPDTLRYAHETVSRMRGEKPAPAGAGRPQAPPVAPPVAQAPEPVMPTMQRDLASAKYGAQEPTYFGFEPTPEAIAAMNPKFAAAQSVEDPAPVYKPPQAAAAPGGWQDFAQQMPAQQGPAVDFSRWMQPPKTVPGPAANSFNPGGFQPFGLWTGKV